MTKKAITRLTAGARAAIKIHDDVESLRTDLRNGPSHVFNDHSKCSPSFCKVVAQVAQSAPSNPVPGTHNTSENLSIDSTIEGIITQEIEEERIMHDEARGGGDSTMNRKNVPDDLFFRVQRAGDRLVSIASQLVSNKPLI